jgi:hypothetical protein
MIRTKLLSSVAALALVAVAPSALAVTTSIAASSGHPFTKAEAPKFDTFDNYVTAQGGGAFWATPLIMSNFSGGDITVVVYSHACATEMDSIVFSFDKFGAVSDWSSWINGEGTFNAVTVPTFGSAFLKSDLRYSSCAPSLAQARVTW